MSSRASAPGKVILFGEHFVVYGVGAILCAIDKRVTVTAEKINEEKIIIESDIGNAVLEPERPISGVDSKQRPFYYLADSMIRDQDTGIRITIKSEIPSGVGLGSSSACCVAGAAAIAGLFKETSKKEILSLAIEAEKTIFQNTSGADCTVCTYGGIMEYCTQDGFEKIESESDFRLVIANSGMEHSTESVANRVRRFREMHGAEFSSLCEKESELVSNVRRLLKGEEIKELGDRVRENQQYLRIIGVSNDTLEEMIRIGQIESFGAKITGAGGGGCIYALADESNMGQTIRQFKDSGFECFPARIDFKGLYTL